MEVPMQIALFYIFIFGHFHMPALGLSGLGVGTVLVVAFWAAIMCLYLHISPKYSRYNVFSDIFKFNGYYIFALLKVGIPLGLMYFIEIALFSACAFLMGYLGSDILAAHQIAYQFFIFAIVIVFGFSQGTTVRVSFEVGKNDKKGLKLAYYVHLILCFSFAFLCALIYFIFSKYFISLDIDTSSMKYSQIAKYAQSFIKVVSILLLIESLRSVLIGAMRGLKQTKLTMYVSFITYWFVGFPAAYFLGIILPWGGMGIWWGITIGIVAATIILWLKFSRIMHTVDLLSLHV